MALFPDEMLREAYKDRPIALGVIVVFDFLVYLILLPIALGLFTAVRLSKGLEWRKRKREMIQETLRQAKGKG